MGNAGRERAAIIDHVSVFTDKPKEENDVQWVNMNKLISEYRPSFFSGFSAACAATWCKAATDATLAPFRL